MESSRPWRGALVILCVALEACAGSSAGAPRNSEEESAHFDPDILLRYARHIQDYTNAMLLCGSPAARDWEEAKHQFELLQPFLVFQDDPGLIRQFRAGSETARRELARRGVMLQAVLTLSGPFNRAKWEEARKTLMDSGEAGQALLCTTLLQMLLNVQNQGIWANIRFALVESGAMALETTIGLTRELV